MTRIPDDELLSAYLDGELSGENLVRAERLLATQPDARHTLDELAAPAAGLRSIPRERLGPGFAQTVLRRAEREILQPQTESASDVAAGRPFEHPPLLSWQRWRRPLAWSALAIAAGLVIMLFSPERREVAMVPAPPDGELRAPAEAGRAERLPATAPQRAASDSLAEDGQAVEVRNESQLQALGVALPAGNEMLIVRCDVSDRASGEAALRKLLDQNSIAWQEAVPGEQAGESAGTGPDQRQASDEVSSTKGKTPDMKRRVVAQASRDRIAGEGDAEAVYLVGDSQQVQGVVDALALDKAFRNVQLEQTPPSAPIDVYLYAMQPAASKESPAPAAVPAGPEAGLSQEERGATRAAAPQATKAETAADKDEAQRESDALRRAKVAGSPAQLHKQTSPTDQGGRANLRGGMGGGQTIGAGAALGRAVRVPIGQLNRMAEKPAQTGIDEPAEPATIAASRRLVAEQQKANKQQGQTAPAQALLIFRLVPESSAAQEP